MWSRAVRRRRSDQASSSRRAEAHLLLARAAITASRWGIAAEHVKQARAALEYSDAAPTIRAGALLERRGRLVVTEEVHGQFSSLFITIDGEGVGWL